MSLETIGSTVTTGAEIISKFPKVGNLRALFKDAFQKICAREGVTPMISARDIEEVRECIFDGEGATSRPSHAAIWLDLLSEIEKDHPQISFWRGDAAKYLRKAGSGQFCLGYPEYSIGWTMKHNDKALGRFSVPVLMKLYADKKIRLTKIGSIDAAIGWHIGTEDEGTPLSQYMEIFELVE